MVALAYLEHLQVSEWCYIMTHKFIVYSCLFLASLCIAILTIVSLDNYDNLSQNHYHKTDNYVMYLTELM